VIVLGDFNANLQNPTTPCDIELAMLFAQLQLLYPVIKFKQRNNMKYTWHKKATNCNTATSRCDYIMTPYNQHINKGRFSNTAPFPSDHQAIWVTFNVAEADTHRQIARRRSTIPKIAPTSITETTGNLTLNTLLEHKEKPTRLLPLDARK